MIWQILAFLYTCDWPKTPPLVLDKVALLLLGILAGQGGNGGKGSHRKILDLEAFQVFEDPRNGVWVQSGMTPIHGTTVQSLPSFQGFCNNSWIQTTGFMCYRFRINLKPTNQGALKSILTILNIQCSVKTVQRENMTFLPESFLALNLTISSPILQLLKRSRHVVDWQVEATQKLGRGQSGRKETSNERQ